MIFIILVFILHVFIITNHFILIQPPSLDRHHVLLIVPVFHAILFLLAFITRAIIALALFFLYLTIRVVEVLITAVVTQHFFLFIVGVFVIISCLGFITSMEIIVIVTIRIIGRNNFTVSILGLLGFSLE